MNKFRFTMMALAVMAITLFISSAAQAQASRTWVSGVGDDVNPCSRTAPCKTYAGAISKTAPGGEISVLDPGGYGTLTITKSITVDGGTGAGWGSTLAALTSGFIINAAQTDIVHLRNLSINGNGNGTDGIRIINAGAGTVHIDDCFIFRFTGDGIEVALTGASVTRLIVRNTVISQCLGSGILVGGTNTAASAISVDNSQITRSGNGIRVNNRGVVHVSNSNISVNNATVSSAAILADSAVSGGAIIDVESSQINFNSIAIQANANQAVRLSNNHITANGNALNFAGGTIASWGNNHIVGNAAGESFASLTDVLPQ
jgi:hypothetical protein